MMQEKTKRLKVIMNIIGCLTVIILIAGYIYEEINGYDAITIIACVIFLTLGIIYLFLYYKYGHIDEFKRSDKYSFEYKDFSELYEDVNKKLQDAGYSIKKEYALNSKEKVYIYMKPITGKMLEMWILEDLISYTKETTKNLESIIEEFYNTIINSEKNKHKKVELKSFSLICTKEYSEELEKLVKGTYADEDLTLTIGMVLSKRELYIASAKELRIRYTEDYSSLKKEFFKIVEATPISKNKE